MSTRRRPLPTTRRESAPTRRRYAPRRGDHAPTDQRARRARSHTIDDNVRRALRRGHRIDITTTGRRSGRPRRIELVFHNIDGRLFVSGTPRPGRTRAWIHNLTADPRMTFHLKGPVKADISATARLVDDPTERRTVCEWIVANAWPNMDVDAMAAASPLIEVELEGLAA